MSRVRRNVVATGLRFGVSAVLALAVTPYALSVLGADRFGVWAIAGGILTAVRLLDLGIKGALTRSVASDPPAEARSALAASLTVALATGTAAVLVGAVAAAPLARFLRVPEWLQAVSVLTFAGTAAVAAVENVFAPYAASLEGTGRTDVSAGIDTVQRLLSGLGVVAVLALGWGLPGLVAKNAALALGAGIAYRVALGRISPALGGTRPMRDLGRARALLEFGRHVQAVNLSALLIDPLGKVFLGRLAGLESVSIYELATTIAGQVGGGFMAVVQIVYPESARARATAEADRRRAELLDLWRRAERAVAVPATGAYVLLAGLAGPFVAAWLGDGYRDVGTCLSILAVGWLAAIVALPAGLVAQGGGEESITTRGALVTAAVGIAGALAAAAPAGAAGVAAARAGGLALGGLAAWWLLAARLGRPRPGAGPALATALLAVAAAWLAQLMIGATSAGLLGVIGAGAAAMILFLVAAAALGLWGGVARSGDLGGPPRESHDADARSPGSGSGPLGLGNLTAAVVPAWAAAERIGPVVAAAAAQVDLVIVVDNGSTDGTADIASAAGGNVRVIRRAENDGFAGALNQGVDAAMDAGASAVLWLNDDALLQAGAVAEMKSVLAERPDVAAVSARMVYADRPTVLNGSGGEWRAHRGLARLRGAGDADAHQYDLAPDPDYPSGAASLVRSSAWSDVGPMDETWYLYYEDADWGLRAAARGWRHAYCPSALISHGGSLGTAHDPARRRYYNVRNRLRFTAVHAGLVGRMWTWLATLWLLAKQPFRWVSTTRRRESEAVFAAVGDHLRGRTGRSSSFG